MTRPKTIDPTGLDVVRVYWSDSPIRIELYIDGVVQDNIKSVELLSFLKDSYRKSNKSPS